MAIVVYPLATRKAVLRAYVDGMIFKDITKMYGPSAAVVMKWARQVCLQRRMEITDEEIDKRLADKGAEVRKMQTQADQRNGRSERGRATDHKYGVAKSALKGPTTIEEYNGMIEECLEHVAQNLVRETSLEGKAKAIMLGTLFMQLKMNLSNPLNMITVADQERVFNQVQKLLGMNDEKKQSRRIDINILNAKVEKPAGKNKQPRVFEAQIISNNPAEPLPGPSITEVEFNVDDFEV